MSDRELLELSAKASGINIQQWQSGVVEVRDGIITAWNPLTDDGDAFRLAVKLGIAVTPYPIYTRPKHSVIADVKVMSILIREGNEKENAHVEIYGDDPCASTRRAIVKAAAEMAKSSKTESCANCNVCRKCGASTVREDEACYKCGHTWFNSKPCELPEQCQAHGCLKNPF